MKKKLFSILLSLAMVVTMMPKMATEVQAIEPTPWAKLQYAFTASDVDDIPENDYFEVQEPTWTRVIKLKQDITAVAGEETIEVINDDVDFELDLNGHIINRNKSMLGAEKGSVFYVDSGADLTITDSDPAKKHVGHYDSTGKWVLGEGEESANVYGGIIMGGTGTKGVNQDYPDHYCGGAIVVSGDGDYWSMNTGTVTMKGGNIAGCAANYGGAIYNISNFTMNGGKIIGNVAEQDQWGYGGNGGAIYTTKDISFNAGIMEHCTAECNGGAVFQELLGYWGTYICGVEIRDCFAKSAGGAVYNNQGKVNFNKDYSTQKSPIISNCKSDEKAGGIYNSGTMEIDSLTETGCFAEGDGGAIYNEKELTVENSEISGCSAMNNGGAIYNKDQLTVKTTNISNCCSINSCVCGGGIYNAKNNHMQDEPTKAKLTDVNISNCKAQFGGAIANEGDAIDKCIVEVKGASTLKNNTTVDGGGAIYSLGKIILTDTTQITDNKSGGLGGGIYASGTITARKQAVVKNNKQNTKLSNIYLENGTYLSFGGNANAPAQGMELGVTTQTAPTLANDVVFGQNIAADYSSYVKSDIPNTEVKYDSNTLYLVYKEAPAPTPGPTPITPLEKAQNESIEKIVLEAGEVSTHSSDVVRLVKDAREAIMEALTVEEVEKLEAMYIESIQKAEVVNASKVVQKKATAYKSGKVKVSFSRLTLSDGTRVIKYQVRRATNKSFTKKLKKYNASCKASAKTVSFTNANSLKKGTRYYYKVRGKVQLADGSWAYTEWSEVKSIKCKKTR